MKHIKHLVILQKGTEDGGSVETVSSAVIAALYNLSKDELLVYDLNDLKGDLQCTATYLRYIDALHTQYPNLNITALSYYMFFLDPYMELFWANSEYGDESGISTASALSATKFPSSGNGYIYNTIPFGQFYNNTDVTSFNELGLFINITEIPHGCFLNASNFTSIDLTNITTLGSCAFEGSGLSGTINLPNLRVFKDLMGGNYDFKRTGNYFKNCPITAVNIGNNVPSGLKITEIKARTFETCTSLTLVTGLEECTSLNNFAFYGCSSLESLIDLSSNLTYIGYETFHNCTSLLCIDLSNTTSIMNGAFIGCSSLLALDTNDPSEVNSRDTYTLNISTMNDSIFLGCKLTNKNIILPNTVRVNGIGNTGIKSIKAVNATSISALKLCPNLEEILIGSLTTLSNRAFERLGNLKIIKIANETVSYDSISDMINLSWPLTTLPVEAFIGCSQLHNQRTILDENNLEITKSVNWIFPNCTSMSSNVFNNSSVKSFEFPQLLSMGSSCFSQDTNLTKVLIPKITTISDRCFHGCSNLSYILFSDQLISIGNLAFYNTGFAGKFDIPDTIESIGYECFIGANNITYFIVRATTPPTVSSNSFGKIFEGTTVLKKIYVPDSSLSDYQTAWANIKYDNISIVNALDVISNLPS